MSQVEVKVIEHTANPYGSEVTTTFQLKYRRFFHSEFMTHRVFSRNASSSRAIPVKKMLSQVWNDPAIPMEWGSNKSGMQAGEKLPDLKAALCRLLWISAGRAMCIVAWFMAKFGLHKQVANRILEPWQFIHVIVTATEWENFYYLRICPMAQPEIRELATQMRMAQLRSMPRRTLWHLPYVSEYERAKFTLEQQFQISTGRCARVSYLNHDGSEPNPEKDIQLAKMLTKAGHMSPLEHSGVYLKNAASALFSNLRGLIQYRKLQENEINITELSIDLIHEEQVIYNNLAQKQREDAGYFRTEKVT